MTRLELNKSQIYFLQGGPADKQIQWEPTSTASAPPAKALASDSLNLSTPQTPPTPDTPSAPTTLKAKLKSMTQLLGLHFPQTPEKVDTTPKPATAPASEPIHLVPVTELKSMKQAAPSDKATATSLNTQQEQSLLSSSVELLASPTPKAASPTAKAPTGKANPKVIEDSNITLTQPLPTSPAKPVQVAEPPATAKLLEEETDVPIPSTEQQVATESKPKVPVTPKAEVKPQKPLAPAKAEPLSTTAPKNQGGTPVQNYLKQLDSLPELKAKLEQTPTGPKFLQALNSLAQKGHLNHQEVIQVQTHLVQQEKYNLSYKGHKTGIDGINGHITQKALSRFLQKSLAPLSPTETVKPPQPISTQTAKPVDTTQPVKSLPSTVEKPTTPSAPTEQTPYPRYDKMFKDGLLDVTIAIGYDEPTSGYAGGNIAEEQKVDKMLQERGFTQADAQALALLKQAGREPKGKYAALYVKENIATADGKPVNSVVRVIKAGSPAEMNGGESAKKAALEGMNQSDMFLYGGHGRYGTGPDFDRNYTVTIDWTGIPEAPEQGKVTYEDYDALRLVLTQDGNHVAAIKRFDELDKQHKIQLNNSNAGNILISKQNKHTSEFGGHVMSRAIETEKTALKDEITQDSYRLWFFSGCRTQDYISSIRQDAKVNQHLNRQNLDLFATNKIMYWHNSATSAMAVLDGVMAQDHTPAILDRLYEATKENNEGRSHTSDGFTDNPKQNRVKP